MQTYSYQARDNSGELLSGELDAINIEQAREIIGKKGIIPVRLNPKALPFNLKRALGLKTNLPVRDLANITRQFEMMFSAGIQFERIFSILANQTNDPSFKIALKAIQSDVASGTRMSLAFKKYPEYFSSLYVSMIEAGQTGGILDKTLKETARMLQNEHSVSAKINSATLYPKIVVFVLVAVIWAMVTFVFPIFADFYKGYGVDLPLPTRLMMGLSTLTTTYWYVLVLMIAVGIVTWRVFAKSSMGKLWLGHMAFRLPIFGKLNLLAANSRFARLVSALYRAGVSLPQSLGVVAGTVNNICFSNEVLEIMTGLEQGRSMSDSMKQTKYFSPMVREACAVGEQTGRLDTVLDGTANFYDEEIDSMVKNLSTLIEPIMISVLFGAVLLLALAVYMPMWNLSKTVLS